MTLSLIKPGGWGVNEKLTSGQITDIDANVVKALDKTSSDTLSGNVTVASSGGLVFQSGADLTAESGANVSLILSGGSAIQLLTGSSLAIANGATASIATPISLTNGGVLSGTFSGTKTLSGTNTISGTLTLSGTTTASSLTMTGVARVGLTSRTLTRIVDSPGFPGITADSFSYINMEYKQAAWAGNTQITWGLPLKKASYLKSVSVYVTGNGHSLLPNLPVLTIFRYTKSTGTITSIGSTPDPSGSVGALDTRHAITVNINDTVDTETYAYSAVFYGETGANVAFIRVSPPHYTADYTEYDET